MKQPKALKLNQEIKPNGSSDTESQADFKDCLNSEWLIKGILSQIQYFLDQKIKHELNLAIGQIVDTASQMTEVKVNKRMDKRIKEQVNLEFKEQFSYLSK